MEDVHLFHLIENIETTYSLRYFLANIKAILSSQQYGLILKYCYQVGYIILIALSFFSRVYPQSEQ